MRRSQSLPGLIAGTIGLLGWLYALFGPTGRYESAGTNLDGSPADESGWTNLWGDQDFEAVTVMFFLVMLLSVIGILVGAVLHGRLGLVSGRVILWISAIVLLAGSILSAFSIGLFLLPGALLALVAAVLSGSTDDRSRSVPAP